MFCITFLRSAEQIEPPNDWLVVTVLKTQYLEAPKPIGGLKEENENIVIDIVYPEWKVNPPLACLEITQNYYWYHRALDFGTGFKDCRSTMIASVDSGIILFAKWKQGYGNRIEIQHENGFISTYSHFKELYYVVGDTVNRGDIIGVMGSTGESTGIHLHFELIYKDIKIDPKIYLKEYL